jgi:hypothetical protein
MREGNAHDDQDVSRTPDDTITDPKRLKAAASGQVFVEINHGNPHNNKGKLTFWLIKSTG